MSQLRILQLSPQIPYPLSDGGKVGIFNITKYLARRGHQITMVAFNRTPNVPLEPLKEVCDLHTIPHSNKNTPFRGVKNLFSNIPYGISKYRSKAMSCFLEGFLSKNQFDVIHADHLHMSYYGLEARRICRSPVILREHNLESVIVERFADSAQTPFFREWMAIQKERMKAYEARRAREVDLCCMMTEDDRLRLLKLEPSARTAVIPAGIDSVYFRKLDGYSKIPFSICLFGSFDWLPNADALGWFIENIFPRILLKEPRVVLHVFGKCVPEKFLKMSHERIVFHGFVENLQEALATMQLTVVPLRIGGGMRLKILESFAMRLTVISTSVGCEGIMAENEKHLLVGNSEEELSNQVVRVLANPVLTKDLSENAYRLAEKYYRWESVAEQLEAAYLDTIHRFRSSINK